MKICSINLLTLGYEWNNFMDGFAINEETQLPLDHLHQHSNPVVGLQIVVGVGFLTSQMAEAALG